jgi:DNA repair photolyase
MTRAPPDTPRKGRGAASNPALRYSATHVEAVDDGWDAEPDAPAALATVVRADPARSIIARNDSPDVPFSQSINPYRGCEHGCVYCLSGDTPILMADCRTRAIADLRAGDVVCGTAGRGRHRRYARSRVLAHWSVIRAAFRVTLEDGSCLVAGADHRFLTRRGWKFVGGAAGPRPAGLRLAPGDELMGTGAFARARPATGDYRRGYLCAMLRWSPGLAAELRPQSNRVRADMHAPALAACAPEALRRARDFLSQLVPEPQRPLCRPATAGRGAAAAVRAPPRAGSQRLCELSAWPATPAPAWSAGFLAGMFDAAGSYREGRLSIPLGNRETSAWLLRSLADLGFGCVAQREHRQGGPSVAVVCVTGGLREHLRFFHLADPAVTGKRDICAQAVGGSERLRVAAVEPAASAMRLYDLTTETADFIADGVVSHNCYARPTHAYLDLSPGLDFETRLYYKANAAERLVDELSRPGYVCKPITLGANTDPYQPIERRLRVTRSLLEVLARCRHPFSVVTKGGLILRDLDLLAEMAQARLAAVHVSITTLDDGTKRTLEPRAASPERRLHVVRALAQAGVPVGVLVAPVIPLVTDHELERILERAADAGARSAGYVLLRLPLEVEALFREWLEAHAPLKAGHVMSLMRQLHGGREYDARFGLRQRGAGPYAALLARRFELACRRLGLNAGDRVEPDTTRFRAPAPRGQLELSL